MTYALVQLIGQVIWLFNIVLISSIVLHWLIHFDIVNRHQPFIYKLNMALTRLTEPLLRPLRNILPRIEGIDLSPIALFLLLGFIRNLLYDMVHPF